MSINEKRINLVPFIKKMFLLGILLLTVIFVSFVTKLYSNCQPTQSVFSERLIPVILINFFFQKLLLWPESCKQRNIRLNLMTLG